MWVGSREMTAENPRTEPWRRAAWRCTNPVRADPLAHGPALCTGDPVRTGVCTLGFSVVAALYTGDPVRRGLCTLGRPGAVQTPSRTTPPVRKVPGVAFGHCTNPLRDTPSSAQRPAVVSRQCAYSYRNTPTSAQSPSSSRHRVPQQAPNISHVLRGHTLFGRAPFAIQAGTLPEGFRTACSGAMGAARVYAGYTCKQRG